MINAFLFVMFALAGLAIYSEPMLNLLTTIRAHILVRYLVKRHVYSVRFNVWLWRFASKQALRMERVALDARINAQSKVYVGRAVREQTAIYQRAA